MTQDQEYTSMETTSWLSPSDGRWRIVVRWPKHDANGFLVDKLGVVLSFTRESVLAVSKKLEAGEEYPEIKLDAALVALALED